MTVFFTSDTHFGHAAIIRHQKRPFATVEQMDAALIMRWNACVRPTDTVYHLGDFCYRSGPKTAADYLARLSGTVHLICGNHDIDTVRDHGSAFASVSEMLTLKIDGQRIVLFHYPLREWPHAFSDAWHLFGHVHGNLDHQPHGFSLDVGVDSHEYRPLSLAQVSQKLEHRSSPFKRSKSST
jgi:calcineurin-like phosphoesterase family protein